MKAMTKKRKGLYWTGSDEDSSLWLTFEGKGLYEEWWTSLEKYDGKWTEWQYDELHRVDHEEEFEGTNHQELAVPLEYLT